MTFVASFTPLLLVREYFTGQVEVPLDTWIRLVTGKGGGVGLVKSGMYAYDRGTLPVSLLPSLPISNAQLLRSHNWPRGALLRGR